MIMMFLKHVLVRDKMVLELIYNFNVWRIFSIWFRKGRLQFDL